MWLSNLGIMWRIELLVAVSLLAILAFAWVTGRRAIKDSIQQTLDHQLTIAALLARSLDERLDTMLTVLETTAAHPDLSSERLPSLPQPGERSEDGPTALLRDAQLQMSSYGRRLSWLDTDGNVIWTEPSDPTLLSRPFPNFAAIRPLLQGHSRYVSSVCQSANLSQPYVVLATTVLRPTGEIGSLLVEEIGADQLGAAEGLEAVVSGASFQFEVIDHEGVILVSSLPGIPFQMDGHADQFTQLIDNREARVSQCQQCHSGDGQDALARAEGVLAFAPLSVAPWGVAVRRPASQVMASASYMRRQMLLGGGVVMAAVLLATWWLVSRRIVGPIRALDEASEQLAAGNPSVAVPRGGVVEIARLANNLERMRVRLECMLEERRCWNEPLEETVDERTDELVILNERLQRKEVTCKQLLAKVLTAQEDERARLARELHDSVGQSLTAIIMTATVVENSLPPQFASGKEKLVHVRQVAAQTLQELRDLIFDLRPEVLDDLGLALALRSQVNKYLEPAGVDVQLRAGGLRDELPAEVETAVFRVVQEAIANIAHHAKASQASISLTRQDNKLIVRVQDNGMGFDADHARNEPRQGWGLLGMEERITLLGGRFHIGSEPGKGTLLLAEVPLDDK